MNRPTFTASSLLYPCEHQGCGRVGTPMRCAWVPFVDPPTPGQWRASAYHLCPVHAAQWEREGIPEWALAWQGEAVKNTAPQLSASRIPPSQELFSR